MTNDHLNETAKPKKHSTISARKPSKRKPKDKPKRPLSAYNYFFKEERVKILKAVLGEDGKEVNPTDVDPDMDDELLKRLKKDGGKVSFEEMGKLIGQRWKDISEERLAHYTALAKKDTERYKKEMETYNGRREELRNEANRSAEQQLAHSMSSNEMPRGQMSSSMHHYQDVPASAVYTNHPGFGISYHMDTSNPPPGYGQAMMNGYHPSYGGYPPPSMDGGHYGSIPSSISANGNGASGDRGGSSGYTSTPYGYNPVVPQEYTSSPDNRNGNQYSYGPPDQVSSTNYSSYPQQAYSNSNSNSDPQNW